MFEIGYGESGEIVVSGRFDAAQEQKAGAVFDALQEPVTVDLEALDYISSLGLGVLLKTQRRLRTEHGQGLKLINVNPHINEILQCAGFSQIFEIEPA